MATKIRKDQVSDMAFNLAEGQMINGKIAITVSSNNITLALKGNNGSDPSVNNPVYVMIGNVQRTITTALSVTKNAGTNWFNAGSAELATKEIDYFAYLGYNATDGVVIGFSRIPFACQYSDFSTTTTNEKYCAISTITTAAATDYYNVIGRFAATLSAGAGYTWTVPTYTAINLIQRPIFTTTWLNAASVTTALSGTFTSVLTTVRYKIDYRTLGFYSTTTVTTNGSAATGTKITTPFSLLNYSSQSEPLTGLETSLTGITVNGSFVSANQVQATSYLNAYVGGNGGIFRLKGFWEI